MSKINKQALREAAEKATPGEWWIDSHGMAMVAHHNDNTMIVFVTDGEQMGKAIRHEDTGNLSHWRNDNDATFIATANPTTVLALLDELEAKDRRIEEEIGRDIVEECASIEESACRAAMLQAGNHTEQHLNMVGHPGDANENVDCRLPFDQWLSQKNEPIDVDCGCVTTEAFYHWLRVAYEAGNSPVTLDGYVLVPKEMTDEIGEAIALQANCCGGIALDIYDAMLEAAPQQEVKSALEHGMRRYAGAMQKLSEGDD
ncbi:ead/Ea22-like family protein [Citrobacter freundii]